MVDCYSAPGLLPFSVALKNILKTIKSVDEVEKISIDTALGSVLSMDITSPLNVPPNDNSAMDGYAFSSESLIENNQLMLAGRSMAGSPFQGECMAGKCIRIMTGAKLPDGCDTVEMQENCLVNEESITFLSSRKRGDNIRFQGEDIAVNQTVFSKGREITAVDIGVLASLGISEVSVYRKLKVAILSTGNELKTSKQILMDGDIYESNGYFLKSMLSKVDVDVISLGIIEDDRDKIKSAFNTANETADVVISSGGVSVGDADYTKEVLDELGHISFWKIAMKPGKPFAFGRLSQSYFFGLPGNPVSALVTAHQLVVPALLTMKNCTYQKPLKLKAKAMNPLKKSKGRMDFQRGVIANNEVGELIVLTTGSQGSGVLSSMSMANCYIVLAAEQGDVKEGEWVDVQLFDKYLQ